MKKLKTNKGITLIALVITIIVLLILAAVSIATLTGENGILTQASKAGEETKKANAEEQVKLAAMNAAMNTQGYKYETEDGQKVPIPAGFAPTQIDGENSVEEGLVITDENGNEFVWIPCDVNNDTALEETETGKINYNAKRVKDWRTKQYAYNGGEWGDSQPIKIGNPSIEEYKGFYIARYEAGIPSNAPFYANSDGAAYKQNQDKDTSDYKPISKRGVQAWNYITQKKAKDAAESMIVNNGVHSYLMDSHAWDTTCRVIVNYDTTKSLTDSRTWGNYYNNTTTKYENLNTLYALHTYNSEWKTIGPYKKGQVIGAPKGEGNNRLELSTGASEDFKAYNIYDLAGNMLELTTENGTSNGDKANAEIPTISPTDTSGANVVTRGGGFVTNGNVNSVVDSNGDADATTTYSVNLGFRVVLYLQPSNK